MFARLTIYENADLALLDEVQRWMQGLDTDPFAGLPGYHGSMTLVDRDNARLVGVGYYDTAGDAREAEAILATLYQESRPLVPEHIRPVLDKQPDSVGVYEIVHRD